jgi:hypothetical protein
MNWFACFGMQIGHIASVDYPLRCGAGSSSGNEESCGGNVDTVLCV